MRLCGVLWAVSVGALLVELKNPLASSTSHLPRWSDKELSIPLQQSRQISSTGSPPLIQVVMLVVVLMVVVVVAVLVLVVMMVAVVTVRPRIPSKPGFHPIQDSLQHRMTT